MDQTEQTQDLEIKISFNKESWNKLPDFMQDYILNIYLDKIVQLSYRFNLEIWNYLHNER